MPYAPFGFGCRTTAPVTGRPRRDRGKNRAQRQARKRGRR